MHESPAFIGRKAWIDHFRDLLAEGAPGCVWPITGTMGIGKSTLARRLAEACRDQRRVHAWLDLQDFPQHSGAELLAAILQSLQGPADARAALEPVRGRLAALWSRVSPGLEAASLFGGSGGLTAGLARIGGDQLQGLLGGDRQAADGPSAELALLELCTGLAARPHAVAPVCLVDTYEHALTDQARLLTGLDFRFPDGPRQVAARPQLAREWLPLLWLHLAAAGWRVVLLGRQIPGSPADAELPRFSREEISAAALTRPALRARLAAERQALTDLLLTLSFGGNPLWLQVALNRLEPLLTPDRPLAELAGDPALADCLPAHRRFGDDGLSGIDTARCKRTLLRRLLPDGEGLPAEAWRIALPRRLDDGLCAALFPDRDPRAALLRRLHLAGLFRDQGERFSLHEEVRDLLLTDAGERGLLERDETRALHDRLWGFLRQRVLDGVPADQRALKTALRDLADGQGPPIAGTAMRALETQALLIGDQLVWMLDAAYHRVLSDSGLSAKGFDPAGFWAAVGGSASLSMIEKWQIVGRLDRLTPFQVHELMQVFEKEADTWTAMFGPETARRLREDVRAGLVSDIRDVTYWRRRVAEVGDSGDHYGLHQMLAESGTAPEAAIESADALLDRFGAAADLTTRVQCANALVNKGVTLGQLGRAEEAVAAYDALLARDGAASEPALREQCAKALVNKGVTLGQLGRAEEAIAAYDALLARDGAASEPALREQCATALVNKGITLHQLGRAEEAITAYDALLARDGAASEPALREQCATALVNKGITLRQLGRAGEAITAYDALLARDGAASEPALREQCAKALYNKGFTLGQLGRAEEVIAAYDALLARDGAASEPALREQCAKALRNKGVTLGQLGQLGRAEEAIAAYDALLARDGAASEPALREQCAKALVNKGVTLGQLGRAEEAIAAYDALLARDGAASEPALREQCATALVNKGITLHQLGRAEEAITAYDALLARDGAASEPALREQCARALVNKGVTLGQLGRAEEEIAAYDALLARDGAASELALRESYTTALANSAELLLTLGRNGETIERLRAVRQRCGPADEESAIMPFLEWLAGAGTGLAEVRAAITALAPEVAFTWGFDEVRPLVAALPAPKQAIAACLIAFFEGHQNALQLDDCLAGQGDGGGEGFGLD